MRTPPTPLSPQGPPHKQRYLSFGGAPAPAWPADPSGPDCGAMLGAVRHELFGSEAFAKLLWGLTELHPIATRSEVPAHPRPPHHPHRTHALREHRHRRLTN